MTKKRMLIKIGGRAFEDQDSFAELAAAIRQLDGIEFVIVHGGGAEISRALKEANLKTTFVDGIRVTTAEDVAIVEKVLSGTINQRIAGLLAENGVPCRRLSGKSDGLFMVEPLRHKDHDLGFVGDIVRVNPEPVYQALSSRLVPVVSPISADEHGRTYNVNADNAAAALATHSQCTDLVYLTDVPGVRIGDEIRHSLTMAQAEAAIASGDIRDGMVAKMRAVFTALQGQVDRVHITQWAGISAFKDIAELQSLSGTVIQR
jgi:acetylglutamate kinase